MTSDLAQGHEQLEPRPLGRADAGTTRATREIYDGRAGVRVGGWEAHEVQGERGAVRFGVLLRHVELASFGIDHGTVVGLDVVWGYLDAGDCRRHIRRASCWGRVGRYL